MYESLRVNFLIGYLKDLFQIKLNRSLILIEHLTNRLYLRSSFDYENQKKDSLTVTVYNKIFLFSFQLVESDQQLTNHARLIIQIESDAEQ